ncbi:hypothetical protein SeMB42_g07498 [Synchytrium endobioticum]|uniref:Uncharacterized protein n=1 Tax=Synchytrium endobioticum TaxID=286115 RepID=A0A507CK23_9FUNG|nr:hypothetical protein SeMB42_g07498 [Synchytrium endobioticum]TPX40008.1 hypothetical protein SeLEV6574_g06863 [Synchytrium endobioticum]
MTTEEAYSSSGESQVDDDDEKTRQQSFEALKVRAAALHQDAAMAADALTRTEAIRKAMPFKKNHGKIGI